MRVIEDNVLPFPSQPNRDKLFSVRKHLEDQGVTSEESMRGHLKFISECLIKNPKLDVTRYRVNPDCPNSRVLLMG